MATSYLSANDQMYSSHCHSTWATTGSTAAQSNIAANCPSVRPSVYLLLQPSNLYAEHFAIAVKAAFFYWRTQMRDFFYLRLLWPRYFVCSLTGVHVLVSILFVVFSVFFKKIKTKYFLQQSMQINKSFCWMICCFRFDWRTFGRVVSIWSDYKVSHTWIQTVWCQSVTKYNRNFLLNLI